MQQEEKQQPLYELFRRILKPSSAKAYKTAIRKFEELSGLSRTDLDTLPLEQIEDKTKDAILQNVGILAPKYLNVILNAVKTYLYLTNRIRSRKAFIEIKFDKSSTLESSIFASALTTEQVKLIMLKASGYEKLILALYGISALRPSIIPYLKVKHIHKDFYTLQQGKISLKKPTLLIIPATVTDPQGRPLRDKDKRIVYVEGNKAKIDFPSFIPSIIAEILESELNKQTVTTETPLTECTNVRDITYIVKKYYKEVGYNGRAYDMRNFGARCLGRLETDFNDKDLKEYLMGHKPRIASGLYTLRGLTDETVKTWTDKYKKSVETWVNINVFGHASTDELAEARAVKEFGKRLGLNAEQLDAIFSLLEQGKMTVDAYNKRIEVFIDKVYNEKLQGMVDKTVSERLVLALEQHNNSKESS